MFQLFLSCFYPNQFFCTIFTLKRENFEILQNGLHRKLWWRRNFVKYVHSISFGLPVINIDAHDFYKWAKKRRKIVQSSFHFRQLMIMKDRCPSYQKDAMELNLYMVQWSYMQLFPILQKSCGWGTILVFVKIVLKHLSILKQHEMVGEWLICSERGIPQHYQVVKRLQRYQKRGCYCSWHKWPCGSRVW